MPFPFTLTRIINLVVIVIAEVTLSALCAVAFHEKKGGAFQIFATFFGILTLLIIIGCLCHQVASQNKEASYARNVGMFSACLLFGIAQAIVLTFHARQVHSTGLCNDFAHASNPCAFASAQLTMAFLIPSFAMIGVILSWIDKFPGAVQVTPRYPITKAPSSHFAAHMHPLDERESYTVPPVKVSTRTRKGSWSDVPL